MSYALGYGAFVSITTDILLPTSVSIGGYLLISQWMIINALYHSPPEVEFTSFADILNIFKGDERKKLPSAYNIHRQKLRSDRAYRSEIMNDAYFMKPFFGLTAKINELIQKHLFKHQYPANPKEDEQFRASTESEAVPPTDSSVSASVVDETKEA
jgi:hypothetical protein